MKGGCQVILMRVVEGQGLRGVWNLTQGGPSCALGPLVFMLGGL